MHVHMYVEIIGKLKKKSACNWLIYALSIYISQKGQSVVQQKFGYSGTPTTGIASSDLSSEKADHMKIG